MKGILPLEVYPGTWPGRLQLLRSSFEKGREIRNATSPVLAS
jgi:hypothetical protein